MTPLSSNPWTSDQLIHMSQSLSEAYGGANHSKTQQNKASWTPQRLVHLSAAMACLLK